MLMLLIISALSLFLCIGMANTVLDKVKKCYS